MKDYLAYIAVALIAIGLTWTIKDFTTPDPDVIVRTDTVRVDVPYEVEVIKEKIVPQTVIEYKTVTDTIVDVRIEQDTVFVDTNHDTYTYMSSFLTSYPMSPRFLELELSRNTLQLTAQRPNGQTQTSIWRYDSDYDYRLAPDGQGWVGIDRTLRSRLAFNHSVQVGYMVGFRVASPYVEYSPKIDVFGLTLSTKLHLSYDPYIAGGIEFDL